MHGEHHLRTLTSLSNLADAYQAAGRTADAITAFEQVLAHCRRALGEDHPDTLASLHNLPGAYQMGGRVAEAFVMFAQVRAHSRGVLG